MDVDSIPYGIDFRRHLAEAVGRCDVLLAVIGERWREVRYTDGPKQGQRRLDDPEDYVLIEIQSALARDIPVVPVLIGHASMPRADDLPDDLKKLTSRQAAEVRPGRDFRAHVDRLAQSLDSRRRVWLWAGACGLVLLLALAMFLFWRGRPEPTPLSNQKLDGPAATSAKVRVLSLDVKHFANVNGRFDQPRGVLGKDSFSTYSDDSVTVEARLSRPAYAYLIAFRPDGIADVCFPESEDEPPPLTDRPHYPSVTRGVNHGLNEGEGLQVFALVVSSQPLPAYREWRSQRGSIPWKKFAAPPGVVWRDDGRDVDPLTVDDPEGKRSKGQEVSGKAPVARLTDWLRQAPDVETVTALGFSVLPKEKR
jgi:hypothetical protein